ncbi:ATP synthase F0, A subunit [Lyngbya aestuarii BL J]|uniref:ATP synthase subunit a n=1 Tax=Lyngbya aestuarii BL J TaxID=1348334 RepID=U7QNN4_9CYAN|nr:F0F1 ATP synthase subunit A [Lyngbya aestuarii]ERT09594.1 ATP synthase F0, A subunit [Lyngbya aestuarii BL J]
MEISPDNIIIWQWGFIVLNATILYTWLVMAILVLGSWWVTRHLSVEPQMSPWQNGLEIIVNTINTQIRGAAQQDPSKFLPLVGTLFLFIALANILTIFPVYESPAGSLSTTAALALWVFVAVPWFGIRNSGLKGYLKHFIQPSPFMLPFQIISEISRTISLAVRLFGNVMSTSLLVAILLSIVPLFFPAVMRIFGVLVGVIQAYVFAILTLVYIASGMQAQKQTQQHQENG